MLLFQHIQSEEHKKKLLTPERKCESQTMQEKVRCSTDLNFKHYEL